MRATTQGECRYVGADLSALTKEAAALAVARIFEEFEAAPAAVTASGAGPAVAPADEAMATASGPSAGDAAARDTAAPQPQPPAAPVAATASAAGSEELAGGGATSVGDAAGGAAGEEERSGAGGAAEPSVGGGGRSRGGPSRATPLTVEQLQGLAVTMADFEGALSKVQPSVRREGFTTKPDVTWEDVVRMHDRHAFTSVNTLCVRASWRLWEFGLAAMGGTAPPP